MCFCGCSGAEGVAARFDDEIGATAGVEVDVELLLLVNWCFIAQSLPRGQKPFKKSGQIEAELLTRTWE